MTNDSDRPLRVLLLEARWLSETSSTLFQGAHHAERDGNFQEATMTGRQSLPQFCRGLV